MPDFWGRMYEKATEPVSFGDSLTYELGAKFIGELAVEDWGCGLGWYRQFAKGPYRGIDGAPSKFCDEVTDLSLYESKTPALFMRHVLEHNPFDWRDILDNAVHSFEQRMVLVIFTPFTKELAIRVKGYAPPDVSFNRRQLTSRFVDCHWKSQKVNTATEYGAEQVFYLERP